MRYLILIGILLLVGCSMEDDGKSMSTQQAKIQCLGGLAGKDNFAPVAGTPYTGVNDPVQRAALNMKFDQTIDLLVAATERDAARKDYLAIIEKQINTIDRMQLDTEDAEQVVSTFEQTLDCLRIESSGGILNRWMYGFNPS